METLLHADIFFFITAIAVVVVGLVLGVAGVYVVLILRDVRKIVRRAENESGFWQEDIAQFRTAVKARFERVAALLDGLGSILDRSPGKGRRRKTADQ